MPTPSRNRSNFVKNDFIQESERMVVDATVEKKYQSAVVPKGA
jgi:hypothetical protein